ncbi:MAG: FHA domain-containing protein [Kofleriaceae bacterium]|nr:FHA domain-containing protein [Kofleriaceae bacterium]
MIVCNRCGKENQDHYKFCLGCGAELTGGKVGGDVGMMKTMMADPGTSPGARPLPGAPPAQAPRGGSGGLGALPTPLSAPPSPLGPPPAMAPMGPPPAMAPMGPPPAMAPMAPPPAMAPMAPPPMAPPPMGPPPGVPGFSSGFPAQAGPPGYPAAPMAPPPMAPPMAAGGVRRCPSCSTDVPPGFRFCGSCGFRMDEASAPNPMPRPPSAQVLAPRVTMTLIRPDGSEGGVHDLRMGENKVGRNHGAIFENDGYLSPLHAEMTIGPTTSLIRDLGSLNGVFVKMTQEEELQPGQIVRIGQELLRFELITPPEPAADGTDVMGSPNPGFWGRLVVIIGNTVEGAAFPLLGETVTLGRERGEINFPDDGYVSGLHARLSIRDGRVFLSDLNSSNGTFMKVNGEAVIGNESFVLLGQQLFRLNIG